MWLRGAGQVANLVDCHKQRKIDAAVHELEVGVVVQVVDVSFAGIVGSQFRFEVRDSRGKGRGLGVLKVFVGAAQAFFEAGAGLPAECLKSRDVEQLARGAVGLRSVEDDFAFMADYCPDGFGQFANSQVVADADVDQGRGGGLGDED